MINSISPDGKWQWNGTNWIPFKKPSHLGRNIVVGVGALFVLGLIGSGLNQGSKPNTDNTASTSSASAPAVPFFVASPSPTAQATSIAKATAPPAPAPRILFDKSGSGISKTAIFQTPSEWSLLYDFDCHNFGSSGNFAIIVYDGSSVMTDLPVNDLAISGTDTIYEHNLSGPYYLEINTECKWHIVIKG